MSLFFCFFGFLFFGFSTGFGHCTQENQKENLWTQDRLQAMSLFFLVCFFSFAISENSYAHPVWLIVILLSFNLLLCYLSSPSTLYGHGGGGR